MAAPDKRSGPVAYEAAPVDLSVIHGYGTALELYLDAGWPSVLPLPPGKKAAVLLVAGAAGAAAHPLGNFTVNTSSGLRVGPDRLDVDYVVDMAEIPTFQTRQAVDTDHDGTVGPAEAASWRDQECPRLAGGLRATVDGQALALSVAGSSLTFPEGAGGLATLRLECALAARLPAAGGPGRSLAHADGNHPGRVGWREITAVGDRATLESADVPTTSSSARLTAYPKDQLSSPLDQRTASLRFHPGGAAAAAAQPAHWFTLLGVASMEGWLG